MKDAIAISLAKHQARLRNKTFFHDETDLVSVLLPGQSALLYRYADSPSVRQSFTAEAPSALPDKIKRLLAQHISIYQCRLDAGAIATLSPQWCRTLQQIPSKMPIVFDEPARHIGSTWRLKSSDAIAQKIQKKGNAGLVDDKLLVIGVTLDRMVFNAELYEKCAMAYALAYMSGQKVSRVPWWVRLIAGRRLKADMKKAVRAHMAGKPAAELTAY